METYHKYPVSNTLEGPCDTLQKLIDTTEVIKPKPYQDPTNYAGEYYECECGCDGLRRGMHFCSECGRELDWEDEKC
jgi:hypothetical protein